MYNFSDWGRFFSQNVPLGPGLFGTFFAKVPLGPVLFGTFCKINYPKSEKVA